MIYSLFHKWDELGQAARFFDRQRSKIHNISTDIFGVQPINIDRVTTMLFRHIFFKFLS